MTIYQIGDLDEGEVEVNEHISSKERNSSGFRISDLVFEESNLVTSFGM